MATATISVHEAQARFLESHAPLCLFCGGVGSGKTWAGALWLREKAEQYPEALGFVGSNTYLQLHKSTLVQLFALFDEYGPSYVFGKAPPRHWGVRSRFKDHGNVLTLSTGAQILCYSLENYNVVRGVQIAYGWLDETRDTDVEAFNVILSRLRGYDHLYDGIAYQLRVTSTPNGFDWMWQKFANQPTRMPGAEIITSTSHENIFLPESYAADLEARLGKQLAKQEVYAEFLSLTAGRAFAFDRKRNVAESVKYDPMLPLIYSSDYNVSPLCAVVLQADVKARTAWVLDEIYLPDNALTRDACREFVRRWKDRKPRVEYDGDIAGKHRDTRGSQSDQAITKAELTPHFPSVRDASDYRQRLVFDGVQAVNALLEPAKGPARLLIHPRCEMLIRDLEQVSFKPGTRELDKSNGQLTHMSDALRYPIVRLMPLTTGACLTECSGEADEKPKRRIFEQVLS